MSARMPLSWLALALGLVLVVFVSLRDTARPSRKTAITDQTAICPVRSTAEKVNQADLILTGRVFLVIPSGDTAEAIITPITVYKGSVASSSLRLAAVPVDGNGDVIKARAGQLHLSSDQPPYLFFLQQRSNGLYVTDDCRGTRLLNSGLTEEERAVLGSGQPISQL